MKTINLITKHKAQIVDDFNSDLITETINADDIGLMDYITDKIPALKRYNSNLRSKGLVCNVKTHIGWSNKPKDDREQELLEKYIEECYFKNGDEYEWQFDSMAESYLTIGKLICCGSSGGYWGFSYDEFTAQSLFNINDDWVNIKAWLIKTLKDEHASTEQFFNAIEHAKYNLQLPEAIQYFCEERTAIFTELQNFCNSCKHLVDWYENAENILTDMYERENDWWLNMEIEVEIDMDQKMIHMQWNEMDTTNRKDDDYIQLMVTYSKDNLLEPDKWHSLTDHVFPANIPDRLKQFYLTRFETETAQELYKLTKQFAA